MSELKKVLIVAAVIYAAIGALTAFALTHPHWGETDDCVVIGHYTEYFSGLAGLGDETKQNSLEIREISTGNVYGIPCGDVDKYPVGTIILARWKRHDHKN